MQLRMHYIRFDKQAIKKLYHMQMINSSPQIKAIDINNHLKDLQSQKNKNMIYCHQQPTKDIEDCFKIVGEMNGDMKNKEIEEKLSKLEKKIEGFAGKIIKLVHKYNIVDCVLQLINRNQDTKIQFSCLNIIKRIITEDELQLNQSSQELLRKIAIVFFGHITNRYEQFYRKVLDILAKVLTKKPKLSVDFLEKEKICILLEALKDQFKKKEKNSNPKQRQKSLKVITKENSLQNLLRIIDIILTNSYNYPNQFPLLKEIVLQTIKYLLQKTISSDFAARLMHISMIYAKDALISPKQFLFIFQYSPIIIKILKMFDDKKIHIIQLFKYGISIQDYILQAKIQTDMLYCLQNILDNGRPEYKQAFWNILVHIKQSFCIEAILKRESLISKLLDLLNTQSIRNKSLLAIVLNYYVQHSIRQQQNTYILSSIIKTSIDLINSTDQNEILAGLDILDKIMIRNNLFSFKVRQIENLKGTIVLKTLWKHPHSTVQQKANQILQNIKGNSSPKHSMEQLSRHTDDHQ